MTAAPTMTATIEIRMMPPVACSPNFHGSMKVRWRAVADLRHQAGLATKIAILEDPWAFDWIPSARAITLDVLIAWHGRRTGFRDDDNAWASLKGLRDGIAELLEVDDCVFRQGELVQVRGEGTVTVTLRETS